MKVLLDTHTFLWWITDDQRLSRRAREVIGDGDNEVYLSAASAWEIAIKVQIGRMKLLEEPHHFILRELRKNAMTSLPIDIVHALHVSGLPIHHRDPFDRMLVAQAEIEGLAILTADPDIKKYSIEVIW